MSLQVGGIDHDSICRLTFGCEGCKYLVEYPGLAPADETIIERLVRAMSMLDKKSPKVLG